MPWSSGYNIGLWYRRNRDRTQPSPYFFRLITSLIRFSSRAPEGMNKASPAFDEKRGERKSGRVEEVRACVHERWKQRRQARLDSIRPKGKRTCSKMTIYSVRKARWREYCKTAMASTSEHGIQIAEYNE